MFNNLSLQSFASIARDKLQGATSPGLRDDARLYRWVLLKNSLTNALSRSTETPIVNAPPTPPTPPPPITTSISKLTEITQKKEDETQFDAFLFPDGDVFAESFVNDESVSAPGRSGDDDLASEAQWLDSLLKSLGDDDTESDTLVTVVTVDVDDEEYEDSELMSLLDLPSSEDLSTSTSSSPESIHLPPSPPLSPLDFESAAPLHINTLLHQVTTPITYSLSDLSDDIDALALPDVIEDSSSDSDSESLNTPFTRSTSSFNSTNHHHHNPNQLATPRAPFVHIVDRDNEISIQYPYEFQQSVPSHPTESYDQEC